MKNRGFEVVKHFENEGIQLPQRSTSHSAGYDFLCAKRIVIPPFHFGDQPILVETGIKAYMQEDEFLMLCNRSSNPFKLGLVMANGVGIIDADYYGNLDNDGAIKFAFYNFTDQDVLIEKGQVIGQGIFMKYGKVDDDTAFKQRVGGFGSTDKK